MTKTRKSKSGQLEKHIARRTVDVALMLAAHKVQDSVIEAAISLMVDIDCSNGAPDVEDRMGDRASARVRDEVENTIEFFGHSAWPQTVLGQEPEKINGGWVYSEETIEKVRKLAPWTFKEI